MAAILTDYAMQKMQEMLSSEVAHIAEKTTTASLVENIEWDIDALMANQIATSAPMKMEKRGDKFIVPALTFVVTTEKNPCYARYLAFHNDDEVFFHLSLEHGEIKLYTSECTTIEPMWFEPEIN